MKTAYNYECPIKKGYTEFKLNKKDHNILFKYRQGNWKIKYTYFIKGDVIILFGMPSLAVKVASLFLLPYYVLVYGVSKSEEIYREVLATWNPLKSGYFVKDKIYEGRGDLYDKIKDLL